MLIYSSLKIILNTVCVIQIITEHQGNGSINANPSTSAIENGNILEEQFKECVILDYDASFFQEKFQNSSRGNYTKNQLNFIYY